MNSNPTRLASRIRKAFPGGGLDLEFETGPGFTILFGASGAGKTTLLDCLAGLKTPDDGEITVGGRRFHSRQPRINLPTAQRKVGYLFQDLALFPHLTVQENVEYGLASLPVMERHRRCQEILR